MTESVSWSLSNYRSLTHLDKYHPQLLSEMDESPEIILIRSENDTIVGTEKPILSTEQPQSNSACQRMKSVLIITGYYFVSVAMTALLSPYTRPNH